MLWRSQVTVVVVSLITVALWCVNTALRDVVGDQGIVAIFPLVVFFGTGILTKDDFNSFLWNIVMLAQVHVSPYHCCFLSIISDQHRHLVLGAITR
jgi:di/tricarboxylate transporter